MNKEKEHDIEDASPLEELRAQLYTKENKSSQRAILIGVYANSNQKILCEEHLTELNDLADTFGVQTITKIVCPLKKMDAATFFQKGKVEELVEQIESYSATLLIVDEDISPAQQRNLEKILKIPVMDRTELIIEIFADRAYTKEARLQIELARTKYLFPRLKRLWSHLSRQSSSGGAYLKGEGEKQIEIDRRLVKRRIEKLQEELKNIKHYRETQKSQRLRTGIPTFAIIGYTNAGKSTLLNALTDAEVFVEDKLFATLDPTTRKFKLPNNQEILLTDTVGFIRKLPHTLVAAFRSTLEAVNDDILLHLIDVSHPMAEAHAEATYAILKELNVKDRVIITVLNKIDLCSNQDMIQRLKVKYPKTVCISATQKIGFDDLFHMMMEELSKRRQLIKVKVPQSEFALVSEMKRDGHIMHTEYEDNYIILNVEIPVRMLHRLKPYVVD